MKGPSDVHRWLIGNSIETLLNGVFGDCSFFKILNYYEIIDRQYVFLKINLVKSTWLPVYIMMCKIKIVLIQDFI